MEIKATSHLRDDWNEDSLVTLIVDSVPERKVNSVILALTGSNVLK